MVKQENLSPSLFQITNLALGKLILALALFSTSCSKNQNSKTEAFKFNLPREVHSLDPLLLRGTAKGYALFNLHRGLYYYNKNNELTAHGAEKCTWTEKTILLCNLKKKRWSDGSPITAQNYIYSYNQISLLKEESTTFLENINSISSLDSYTLEIKLIKEDEYFLHRLTSFNFFPRNENKIFKTPESQLFSGPYKLKNLNSSKIHLENNSFYDDSKRPEVIGLFVDDSSTALNMYNGGLLNFLRYLESSNIDNYKNVLRSDYAKLDGIFISAHHIKNDSFRQALIHALDFKTLQRIFRSPSIPGCLGVPKKFFKEKLPCFTFDLKKSQKLFKLYGQSLEQKNLKIAIPSLQSDDHKQLALWAKEQWRKNLGLNFEIKQLETRVFYDKIKQKELSVYRKAVHLDELSCAHAKKALAFQPEFKMLKLDFNQNCHSFFEQALSTHQWIPLGMPAYAHLHSKRFSGYYINLLGHFGLENLERKN